MFRAICIAGALVLVPVVASAQQPCTADARVVVSQIYQRVLEREMDGGGTIFIGRLEAGTQNVRNAVRDVALSAEHLNRFLSGNSMTQRTSAATYLYRHLLGRQPDADGLRAHINILATQGPNAAIYSLVDSEEYTQKYGDDGVPGTSTRYCGPNQAQYQSSNNGNNGNNGRGRGQMRFAGQDRNRDGQISREEWNGTRESFVVHDWNGDNVLSGDEVAVGGRRAERAAQDDDFNPAAPGRLTSWTTATFTNLDRNRDDRLAASEWYYDTESFVRADRNRDGFLARAEFLGTADAMDDDRDDRFDNLDVNRNGRVERNEWHASADAFEWLDRNRDGVLTRAEALGNQTAADQFTRLDANRDGRLTTDEWRWSRRSFTQQDVNGDGILSRREFTAGGAAPTTGVR